MSLSKDFVEFVECLNRRTVDYLLVGGHAVAFHGWPRFTKDIDFWIRPTPDNAQRVLLALDDFGFGDVGLNTRDFSIPGKVVQLGVPPNRIDLITRVDGVEFKTAWKRRIKSEYAGIRLLVIHRDDLFTNKQTVGRLQDRLDIEKLTEHSD